MVDGLRSKRHPAGLWRYCGISPNCWESSLPIQNMSWQMSFQNVVDYKEKALTLWPISWPLSSGLPTSPSPSERSSPFRGDWNLQTLGHAQLKLWNLIEREGWAPQKRVDMIAIPCFTQQFVQRNVYVFRKPVKLLGWLKAPVFESLR